MLKKFFIIITIILTFNKAVYGYSSSFEYMITTLNIEKQNENGNYINEEIYNEYNLIVYGNPNVITKNQRWKDSENGKWTKNGSAWNGSGIRGEYWILGENYFRKRST